MRRPPRPSRRQMMLPLERTAAYRPTEEMREEIVRALADLLLEATSDQPYESSQRRGENEPED